MITIRKLQQTDDLSAVSKIYAQSWRYAYKGLLPQEYLDGISDSYWIKRLDKPNRHILVAELDGKLIGTASYGEARDAEYKGLGELYSIYILPEYIGKGYGKEVINAVFAEQKAIGYREVYLWVLEENLRARKFYEKAGFMPGNEIKDTEIGGKSVREVRYYKEIESNV